MDGRIDALAEAVAVDEGGGSGLVGAQGRLEEEALGFDALDVWREGGVVGDAGLGFEEQETVVGSRSGVVCQEIGDVVVDRSGVDEKAALGI